MPIRKKSALVTSPDDGALAVADAAKGGKKDKKAARPITVDRAQAEVLSQPSVRVFVKWTPRQLTALELSADGGDLSRLADLCDQMIADDRFGTLLETLAETLLGSDLTFEKDDSTTVGNAEKAADLKLDWPRAYARDELSSLVIWMALLGVGFGKHEHWVETETGRVVPRFRTWHPKHFRYDWQARTWLVRTADGALTPISAGDGTWVIVTRRGEFRPWATGLWRGLARWFLLKSYAISDWGIHTEKSSKLVVESDADISAADRRALAQELFEASKDAVISLPVGFRLSLVELSANTRDIYQAQIEAAEMAAAIAIVGQNLSSRVDGGSYAATETHAKKETQRVHYLSGSLSTAIRDQSLSKWAEFNYGDEKLAPYPKWHTDPPENKGAKAELLSTLATALVTLQTAGFTLSAKTISEVYGIDLEVAPKPEAPPEPAAVSGKGTGGGGGGKVLPFPKPKTPPHAVSPAQASVDPRQQLLFASGDKPASAEGFLRGQLYADDVADASVEATSQELEGFVGRIMSAVDDAPDYETARAAILQTFADEPDPDRLSAIVEAGIIMANLAGRHAVQQDAPDAGDDDPDRDMLDPHALQDTDDHELKGYGGDQPRAPAGSPGGGQWTKHSGAGFSTDSYSHTSGAKLVKIKTRTGSTKDWEIHHADGTKESLGKKATFTTAERNLAKKAAEHKSAAGDDVLAKRMAEARAKIAARVAQKKADKPAGKPVAKPIVVPPPAAKPKPKPQTKPKVQPPPLPKSPPRTAAQEEWPSDELRARSRLPAHPTVAKLADALTKIDTTGKSRIDGAEARAHVDDFLKTELGLHKRPDEEYPGTSHHRHMWATPGLGALGTHDSVVGGIALRPAVVVDSIIALTDRHQRSGVLNDYQIDSVNVVMHEAIHGHGIHKLGTMSKLGRMVEEGVTETVSRHATGKLLGRTSADSMRLAMPRASDKPGVEFEHNPRLAYDDHIADMMTYAKQATGWSHEKTAAAYLQGAIKYKQNPDTLRTPDDVVEALVKSIPFENHTQRATMRDKLRAVDHGQGPVY